jgi:hypothetical protein
MGTPSLPNLPRCYDTFYLFGHRRVAAPWNWGRNSETLDATFSDNRLTRLVSLIMMGDLRESETSRLSRSAKSRTRGDTYAPDR